MQRLAVPAAARPGPAAAAEAGAGAAAAAWGRRPRGRQEDGLTANGCSGRAASGLAGCPSNAAGTGGPASLALAGLLGLALAPGRLLRRRQRPRRGRTAGPIALRAVSQLPSALHKTIGKKELKQTISWMLNTHGTDRTVQLLDTLKELGFEWATRAGVSIGVEDLCVPEAKGPLCEGTTQRSIEAEARYENGDITVVEKFLKVTDEWTRASEQVKDAAMGNFKQNDPTNPVYMMANSGARGNISQVRQLIAMRGLMADANGQLIDVPIKHCLREGMTVNDMLISGHGARKGVIDTALRTADSGYLYRRLDFAASNVVVRAHDCGTPETMRTTLRGTGGTVASLEERLRGRVLAEAVHDPSTGEALYDKGHLLSYAEAQDIASRWQQHEKSSPEGHEPPSVYVRSPLTCKLASGICAQCYGEDLSTPGQVARLGHPAGTIAAQSMGEPGTQLTMRTFHTGGAFEGGAGKGLQAAGGGVVELHTAEGVRISRPEGIGGALAVNDLGQWVRTSHGELACRLSCAGSLRIMSGDKEIQKEELEPGTLVRVQDGQKVTIGQVLLEQRAPLTRDSESELEKIPKPILAEEGGEVLVATAPTDAGCFPSGSSLVWVLQGASAGFEQAPGCAVAVRRGDVVAKGLPLAAEWASARRSGVPRFRAAGPLEGLAATPAVGWRQMDWGAGGAADAAAWLPAEDPGQLQQGRLLVRTDFDWFPVPAGRATEYQAACSLPAALRAAAAAPGAGGDALALPPVAVYCHAEAETEAEGVEEFAWAAVSVTCAPTLGGGSLRPVSRTAHPQHVRPLGGLVLELGAPGAGRAVAWCPEEVHRLRVREKLLPVLLAGHGYTKRAGEQIRTASSSVVTTSVEGSVCFYFPCHQRGRPVVVEEPMGVLRREVWDRLQPFAIKDFEAAVADSSGLVDVEVVVKPGSIFAAPSQCFDETWFSVRQDGVHLHQKLVPPGVDFISSLPGMRSKDYWRVVELLDSPTGETGVCRVLVRPTTVVGVPDDPPPGLPVQAKCVTSWYLPYASGEVVPSLGPIVLAYEVTSSLSRHPLEPHCVTAVPEQGALASPPSQEVVALAAAVAAEAGLAGSGLVLGPVPLPVREWAGGLCIVQHSPVELPTSSASGGAAVQSAAWREPPPRHLKPTDSGAPVARRLLPSPGAGCVYSVTLGGGGRTAPGKAVIEALGAQAAARSIRREAALPVLFGGSAGAPTVSMTVVRPEDCSRLFCRARPSVGAGSLVRRGDGLSAAPEDVAPLAGQVLFVEEEQAEDGSTAYVVTLRRGRAYLITGEGQVLVKTGSIASKGDLLGTEALVVPKTADIVQGLPKINKLFEALGENLHDRMELLYQAQLRSGLSSLAAAKAARDVIQQEIVDQVQTAYLDQGVNINGRHVELVVRRMTEKCVVLSGLGAALAPGMLVDYRDVEALMVLHPTGEVRVRPVVKGITKVGMDSHVMVAMGFREVDNVLTSAVLKGPLVHPVVGIKENLMVGKRINVGTNFPAGTAQQP